MTAIINLLGSDTLRKMYDKVNSNFHSVEDNLNARIDNIVAQSGASDTEVVDARTDTTGNAFGSLKARLDDQENTLNRNTPIVTNSRNKINTKNELFFAAHAGGDYLAPENTIPAYQQSIERGYQAIETDITFTSDGEFVMLHDTTVDRTTDGTGTVYNMTLAEVRALDAGSWFSPKYAGTQVPLFDELLSICKAGNVVPMVEIKLNFTTAQLEAVVAKLIDYDMLDRAIIISGDLDVLQRLRTVTSDLLIGYLGFDQGLSDQVLTDALSLGNCFVNADYQYITAERVDTYRSSGVEIGLAETQSYAEIMEATKYGITRITSGVHMLGGSY